MRNVLFITVSFLFSTVFFSCKDDAITNGVSPDAYFSWSAQPVPFDTIYRIFALDFNNVILNSTSGIKMISEGKTTTISVNDTSFNYQSFLPYSSNYYVFSGNRISAPSTPMIKIYDNGIYKNYNLPSQASSFSIAYVSYFAARDIFYCVLYPESKKYYLFNNGIITEFELSEGRVINFFKANGNLYARAVSTTISGYSYYRVTEAGAVFLRAETYASMPNSQQYFIENDLIKTTSDSTRHTFSYFTEQGWQNFLTHTFSGLDEYISNITGESRNKFLAIKLKSNQPGTDAYFWDGAAFTRQRNFPDNLSQLQTAYFAASNFYNNSFYLYANYGSRYLTNAVFRTNNF